MHYSSLNRLLLVVISYIFLCKSSLAYLGLPLCSSVSNPEPRVNCADLVHLPLCTHVVGIANPNVNCVNECDITNTDHGVNCIRFCSPAVSTNCVTKQCHQLSSAETPDPNNNCDLIRCNKLLAGELNDTKFQDDSKQYCDGNIKCFEFEEEKLPFLRSRANNTMCDLHNCPVTSASCSYRDEITIIESKTSDYQDDYKQYITLGNHLDAICKPVTCNPVLQRVINCGIDGSGNATIADYQCDDNLSCSGGFCTKEIDCNLASNSSEDECQVTHDVSPVPSTANNSWLYRPSPPYSIGSHIHLAEVDSGRVCYTKSNMKNNGWGGDLKIGLLNLGYFHAGIRSPGYCNFARLGGRGVGYPYLCGFSGSGSLYSEPGLGDEFGYIQDYVKVNFEQDDPDFRVTACVRYKNSGDLGTCGKRKCRIDSIFGSVTQWCGYDVCRELIIRASNENECSASSSVSGSCAQDLGPGVDDHLRLRAVKNGRRVCVFLDLRGTFAYDADYYNGSEFAIDDMGTLDTADDIKFCLDGEKGSEGNCSGYNTNFSPGSANIWRTLQLIKHSNGYDSPYKDSAGNIKYMHSRDKACAYVPLRRSTPRLYNVATSLTSPTIFEPPLSVINARVKRGGIISISDNSLLGETDFYNPEIEVAFGNTRQLLSLSLGYLGTESSAENYPTSPSSASITTTVNGINYAAEISVRKEYSSSTGDPIFCLYRRFDDGSTIVRKRMKCVNRKKPDIIDNPIDRNSLTAITLENTSTYQNNIVGLKLISSFGSNGTYDDCTGDDLCTNKIIFRNIGTDGEVCNDAIEKYNICVAREKITTLYNECVSNAVNLQNAINNHSSTASFEIIAQECDDLFSKEWNTKKGYVNSADDIFNTDSTTVTIEEPNAYGVFNEVCIVKGFEDKLKSVIAYKTSNKSVRGKCVIAINSPYLVDNSNNTNCNDGGKAPNCICQSVPEGYEAQDLGLSPKEFEIRKETPREAGLCIDSILPNICPARDYTPGIASSNSDPDFTLHSVNKLVYDDSTGVHHTHENRSLSTFGHYAEFKATIEGVIAIGQCKAFWKERVNSLNVKLKPKLECTPTGWSSSITNDCIRYSCPVVTTNSSGINPDGNYGFGYGAKESGENKGLSHGFALWDKLNQLDDFLDLNVEANRCIAGFKPTGSTLDSSSAIFVGGSLPTRTCNQLGEWSSDIQNACERVYCPEIRPDLNDINDPRWLITGGAEFLPRTPASRNRNFFTSESIATGNCYNGLGFTASSGGNLQARCNSLGQWNQDVRGNSISITNYCDSPVNYCAALTPTLTNESLTAGASFPTTAIASSATGICDNALGYFNTDSTQPTRLCGFLGVWDAVDNPCTFIARDQCVAEIAEGGIYDATDKNTLATGMCDTVNSFNTGYAYRHRRNDVGEILYPKRFCNSLGYWEGPIEDGCIKQKNCLIKRDTMFYAEARPCPEFGSGSNPLKTYENTVNRDIILIHGATVGFDMLGYGHASNYDDRPGGDSVAGNDAWCGYTQGLSPLFSCDNGTLKLSTGAFSKCYGCDQDGYTHSVRGLSAIGIIIPNNDGTNTNILQLQNGDGYVSGYTRATWWNNRNSYTDSSSWEHNYYSPAPD